MKKLKIVTISDHPLAQSGVGLQAKYVIDHLVESGKFSVLALGAAIKHQNYSPQKLKEWGDDVVILPIDGYGDKALMRKILDIEKPDAIWFITDPRFYTWLWSMEDEIHQQCPLIYWHVWDNPPYPKYNEHYYKSTDFIGCINKLTHKFLSENGFAETSEYVPHGVPESDYRILPQDEIKRLRQKHLGDEKNEKFVLFYNSRNALRKRTGNVMWAFKLFLDMLPEDERKNCFLTMQTPPYDPEGQNLFKVAEMLEIQNSVGFNDKKVENSVMNEFYNIADLTISLSTEEGFGLSVLESLMTGTPVICTKTGGMQDQVIDEELNRTFGHCLESDATTLLGSQATPYIYSHCVSPQKAALAIFDLYSKKKELGLDYKNTIAGQTAHDSAFRRFNLKEIQNRWAEIIEREIAKFKSTQTENKEIKTLEI